MGLEIYKYPFSSEFSYIQCCFIHFSYIFGCLYSCQSFHFCIFVILFLCTYLYDFIFETRSENVTQAAMQFTIFISQYLVSGSLICTITSVFFLSFNQWIIKSLLTYFIFINFCVNNAVTDKYTGQFRIFNLFTLMLHVIVINAIFLNKNYGKVYIIVRSLYIYNLSNIYILDFL